MIKFETIKKVLSAYNKVIVEIHEEGMTLDDFTDKQIADAIFEELSQKG